MKLKGKVYKTVVRPALLYGAETWETTRGQEARLEVNEMRMLRWMCGVTRRAKIRNEHIRGTTRVVQASKKITEKRLKWYGHLRRMKEEHIVRTMLDVDKTKAGASPSICTPLSPSLCTTHQILYSPALITPPPAFMMLIILIFTFHYLKCLAIMYIFILCYCILGLIWRLSAGCGGILYVCICL